MSTGMDAGSIAIGQVETVYTSAGRPSGYRQEIRHNGLHEYRLLRAPDKYILENKRATLVASWKDKWNRVTRRAAAAQSQAQSKDRADAITAEAQSAIEQARGLLSHALKANTAIPWAKLADVGRFHFDPGERFPVVKFDEHGKPLHVAHVQEPPEPLKQNFERVPTLLSRLLPPIRRRIAEQDFKRFEEAHDNWWSKAKQIRSLNQKADGKLREANSEYQEALHAFELRSQETKARVADLRARYETKDPAAVTTIADLVLAESQYPDWIIRDPSTGYLPETEVLIVEDTLPTIDVIPHVYKVTYVASRNEMRTTYLKDVERERLYDCILYQIALRTIYELFHADRSGAINAVVYNGWLTSVNKGTGIEETGCLLSLQASRDELSRLDLSKVDPKACFRQLKGISAAKLSGITPVAPIARMNTTDPRFVASHEVASRLDEGVNLASIDWEDFEHLVREIFEREFTVEGSEVKVTRASADGGVDAVVFDPDPIRGGKIVVQAKRYTATVGVSAVRDLYGTMLNEGAMKGILVTTSDYGPDSYSFAKDKPITLLSGGNLLQIMERHGHKARIDLAEARRLRIANE